MKKILLLLYFLASITSVETYAKGNKEEKCQELIQRINETEERYISLLNQGNFQDASLFEQMHRKLKKKYKRDCTK